MKNCNNKNKLAQKGGLMIEALAMLGLIAVVTPTMYKKSAERTLEVEDINTASTVRSYINAAESYIAANYISLLDQVPDGGVKALTNNDLQSFLPYQFNVTNALYDYDTPKASVVRNGNNLTAFALFPAKGSGDEGIGQERTARIASLVGANGGYVTGTQTARGVGGIWSLDATAYDKVFTGDSSPVYSLVTASSNVINGSSASAMVENTKYLQRTAENNEKWRNSMRTDIYMGGYETTDPDNKVAGMHSIRNINSLIVGAENDISATTKNGLYINKDGTNPNAYIGGTLKAAVENLFADTEKMRYAKNDDGTYKFEVDNAGNVTNYGNIDMGTNISDVSYARLGHLTKGDRKVNADGLTNNYLFNGTTTATGASVSLLTPNIFQVTTDETKLGSEEAYDTHVMIEKTGYKGAGNNDATKNKNSLGATITPAYNGTKPKFPVVVGSNMMVEGLLTAGQLDTQNLRTASFQSGSAHIDDANKWLEVDKDGVVIQDTEPGRLGTVAKINSSGINLRTGQSTAAELGSNAELAMAKDGENGHIHGTAPEIVLKTQDSTNGKIMAKNANLGMQLSGKEITIGDKNTFTGDADITSESGYRMLTGTGGNVDLIGTNLKVVDQNNKNVLTIRGNGELESVYGDNYNDFINNPGTNDPNYNMAAHGNVLFTGMSTTNATEAKTQSGDDTVHYMALGPDDSKAAVNIVEGTEGTDASQQRLVFVDMSSKDAQAYINGTDYKVKTDSGTPEDYTMQAGSVYIRKGLMEVVPDKADVGEAGTNTSIGANSSNGVIRASRLVANNVDSSGNQIAVPKNVTDDAYAKYNGNTHANRYDTYMVNPAYTSVMKDIKLTTRGGARLSDVLPDFITKALYVATNTYNDTMTKMEFTLDNSSTFELTNAPDASNATDWASPFMGLAPAPQCPPGYGRVITVAPAGFMMAQAGNLSFSDIGGKGGINRDSGDTASYFVDERAMSGKLERTATGMTNQANQMTRMTPAYRELQVNVSDGGGTADVKVSGEEKYVEIDNITGVSVGTNYNTMGLADDGNGGTIDTTSLNTSTYVLSSIGNAALPPLVFQQSTWLKTLAVPVFNNSTVNYDSNENADPGQNKYGRGWAILMGFLYPQDLYGEFICNLAPDSSSSCSNASYVGSSHTDVYWNIFPVKKHTLEAFVTTYCYFDRTNVFGGYGNDIGVDNYDSLSNVATSYEKVGSENYLKSLNDPALKYNEVW